MNLKMTEGMKVKKALLVIDMQNVCVGKNHATYFKYDNEILIQTVNKVIDANESNVVVYIKNIILYRNDASVDVTFNCLDF